MIGAAVQALSERDPLGNRALFFELERRYLIWDAFVGGARRVDLHPLVLSSALHDSAVRTAEDAWRIVSHLSERAMDDESELQRYGLAPDAVILGRAARNGGDAASLVRVDLLLDESGSWRACEVNVDCPGGLNEAVGLAALAQAAGFRSARISGDPLSALANRLCALARESGGTNVALVHATAYAEDLQIAALVRRSLRARGCEGLLVPATALSESAGRLYARGRRVGAVYRYFPAEYMQGFSNVGAIARCLEAGSVRSLTSYRWYPAQSKFGFARAWAKRRELPLELDRALGKTLPFSVDVAELSPERLVAERTEWVVKRALGRVGDQVAVGALCDRASWKAIVGDVFALCTRGERWIAQRLVRQVPLSTPWGDRLVTLGAYLCDGKFVGYFARLTPDSHVSHDALCVPVFLNPVEGPP